MSLYFCETYSTLPVRMANRFCPVYIWLVAEQAYIGKAPPLLCKYLKHKITFPDLNNDNHLFGSGRVIHAHPSCKFSDFSQHASIFSEKQSYTTRLKHIGAVLWILRASCAPIALVDHL